MRQRPAAADPAVRSVLEGMPWIGFYRGDARGPEDDPFPACVRALLEYQHNNLGLQPRQESDPWHVVHVHIKGACGASFRLGFDSRDWDWGAFGILAVPDPPAVFRDGLEAAGYRCEVLLRKPFAQSLGIAQETDYDEATFRERIIRSIRAGLPVIALGVVGPPECALITGYDDGGRVLVGRSCFQDMPEFAAGLEYEEAGGNVPDPYFRKRDWYADTQGLIVLGEKIPPLTGRELHLRSLRRALQIMRTPRVRGYWTGQAAFTMWADTLLKDEDFPAADLALLKRRHEYHHEAGGTLAEARAYGGDYLRYIADREPVAADELLAAADCFGDEHDLVWAIWEFTGGMVPGDEGARKLARPDLRGRLVPLIRLARRRDAEAAAHIENALRLLGDSPAPEAAATVLDGVPRVGYDKHLCPFPGSLYAVMQYLDDPVEYEELMGISGAAFRRLWNRDDGGNVDLGYLAPEVFRHTALGLQYDLRIVPREKDRMVAAIRESIARGRPVIAFGIIGPPEAGLVAGYSRDGETLHGWSYFQESKQPGYYGESDWFAKFSRFQQAPDAGLGPVGTVPHGLVIVGDKNRWREVSRREILMISLEWAIDLSRTPRRPNLPDHVSGLAAYEAWAAGLEVDADYPAGNAEVLATRAMVHSDQVVMLYERHQAASFLRLMMPEAPEAPAELIAAAELYDRVADVSGQVWKWGMWTEPAAQQALAEAKTRREFAAQIRAAAALEEQAVSKLEAALALMQRKP